MVSRRLTTPEPIRNGHEKKIADWLRSSAETKQIVKHRIVTGVSNWPNEITDRFGRPCIIQAYFPISFQLRPALPQKKNLYIRIAGARFFIQARSELVMGWVHQWVGLGWVET